MRAVRIGTMLWILSVQYYIVQILAALAWSRGHGYSLRQNTISDLANTHCGAYGNKFVCSPLHGLMNSSFIVLGITMIGGAVLLQLYLEQRRRLPSLGFVCMAFAGMGTMLVGFFPENTISQLHILGATLTFIFGNVSMIILSIAFRQVSRYIRYYTFTSGAIGLIALVLFRLHDYIGLGIGGMERIVAYPQSMWTIVFGMYVLCSVRDNFQKSVIG